MTYHTIPQDPNGASPPEETNLQKLATLFPSAVKDGQLDLEALKEELGDFTEIQPGDERYELTWAGKQAAKKKAYEPLLGKTLKPLDDGVNPETSENLYIEGDNLEALKLLRTNYYGEVKMIYIDPPYNTGKDFVYTDKFATSKAKSDKKEGTTSEDGEPLQKNEKSSNRFHAEWLDMMYPRLKLAKDLLREDGVIFISIDDNEVANLRQLCDEIFGEENLVAELIWRKRKGGGNDSHYIAVDHEYIICLKKNKFIQNAKWRIPYAEDYLSRFKHKDNKGRYYWDTLHRGGLQSPIVYDIKCPDNTVIQKGTWQISKESFEEKLNKEEIRFKKNTDNSWKVHHKIYQPSGRVMRSIYEDTSNKDSANEIKNIFKVDKFFDTPKPTQMIETLISLTGIDGEGILLDFYSGSASSAHALIRYNAINGGALKHIMVQYPESTPEKSEARKAGYETIAEIGKERIRRAGAKILKELEDELTTVKDKLEQQEEELKAVETKLTQKPTDKLNKKKATLETEIEKAPLKVKNLEERISTLDIGFKSFRIEDTKINWLKKDLSGEELDPAALEMSNKDKLDFVPGFTDRDIVYEVMLRQSNIPLTQQITTPVAGHARTYLYGESYLICLEETVTKELVESLAALEPTPVKYIFRDSAFGENIALKDETFRRLNAEIEKNTDGREAYTVEFI